MSCLPRARFSSGLPSRARIYTEPMRVLSVLPLGFAPDVLGRWGRTARPALKLPKTCPTGSARRSGEARFHPFPASFDSPGRGHLVEALRFTEVLRRTGKDSDLQAFANRAESSRAIATTSGGALWCCVRQQKSALCGDFPFSRAL